MSGGSWNYLYSKDINDLIEKYRIMSTKGCILFPQRPDIAEKSNLQYKETADCLEELKAYRENDGISENVYRVGCKFGYNRAIDDFKKELFKMDKSGVCFEHCQAQFCEGNCNDCVAEIRKIAEQLKGVKRNEDKSR